MAEGEVEVEGRQHVEQESNDVVVFQDAEVCAEALFLGWQCVCHESRLSE